MGFEVMGIGRVAQQWEQQCNGGERTVTFGWKKGAAQFGRTSCVRYA